MHETREAHAIHEVLAILEDRVFRAILKGVATGTMPGTVRGRMHGAIITDTAL